MLALVAALAAVLGGGGPARAVIGAVDDVPAATLLLPYFEVDPNGTAATGVTTLLTINNASATAILAHVTVWSDLAVPVMAFNLYLTGYDAETIDLQTLLAGALPRTATDGQDPQDDVSPQGDFSQDINFASCSNQLPPGPIPEGFVPHVRASLSGQFSELLGGCAGRDHGDGLLRGYVTVDTVNNCTARLPGDPGYFISGGVGDATNQNVLWGDYIRIDKATRRMHAESLVHVEASSTDPETSVPGEYTFYGRLVGFTAADNREPLATTFAVRYVNTNAPGFPQRTTLVTWRDPKVPQGDFPCGNVPTWFPLAQEQIVIFDEQENPELPPTSPVSPQPPGTVLIPFPGAAQRVRVGGPDLPVGFTRGWMYLNLNTSVTVASGDPPEDPAAAQAWVSVVQEDADVGAYGVRGHFSAGYGAVALDSAANASHFVVGGF
jgi:hypothetical protein